MSFAEDELEVLKVYLGGREPSLEPLLDVVRGVQGSCRDKASGKAL